MKGTVSLTCLLLLLLRLSSLSSLGPIVLPCLHGGEVDFFDDDDDDDKYHGNDDEYMLSSSERDHHAMLDTVHTVYIRESPDGESSTGAENASPYLIF